MMEATENRTYTVVVNHEEQYSFWPTEKPLPQGWDEAGKTGSVQDCQEYIGRMWIDLRPLSVRQLLESAQQDSLRRAPDEGETT